MSLLLTQLRYQALLAPVLAASIECERTMQCEGFAGPSCDPQEATRANLILGKYPKAAIAMRIDMDAANEPPTAHLLPRCQKIHAHQGCVLWAPTDQCPATRLRNSWVSACA